MSKPKEHVNRTPETLQRYRAQHSVNTTFTDRKAVRDFTYWKIVENKFPYDAVFSVHHMLMPKRVFTLLKEATPEELNEYHDIISELNESSTYDGHLSNFYANQSKPRHYHIHLFCWHYRDAS